MNYKIEVSFDDDTSDVGKSRTYYRVLDKHNALGIGHERTLTSSMFISSEKPLNLGELARNLEDIEILRVRKVA